METDWPVWLTLGGSAGSTAAGSDWQTWLTFVEGLLVFAAAVAHGGVWVRDASLAATTAGRRAKVDLAILFVVGGFAVGGLRCLMIWVPAWGAFHLTMLALLAALVKFGWDRRRLRVTFAAAERVPHLEAAAERSRQSAVMANEEKERAFRMVRDQFARADRRNKELESELARMRQAAVRMQERAEERHDAELEAEAASIRQALHDIRGKL